MIRRPAIPKYISEITSEDKRVAVVCTVINKGEDHILVDDGTGVAKVYLEDQEMLKKTDEHKLIRVIGRVGMVGDNPVIRGEIIQDMSGLDIELYKKVKERGY